MKPTIRDLTLDECEALVAKHPKAKRIAIVNFCSSMGGQTAMEASLNLGSDQQAYRWNDETRYAIKEGIRLAEKSL